MNQYRPSQERFFPQIDSKYSPDTSMVFCTFSNVCAIDINMGTSMIKMFFECIYFKYAIFSLSFLNFILIQSNKEILIISDFSKRALHFNSSKSSSIWGLRLKLIELFKFCSNFFLAIALIILSTSLMYCNFKLLYI